MAAQAGDERRLDQRPVVLLDAEARAFDDALDSVEASRVFVMGEVSEIADLQAQDGAYGDGERPISVPIDPMLQVDHRGSKRVTLWLLRLTKLSETRVLAGL